MVMEGLDKVVWASLRHAYGPATDRPEHLRNLASSDPREQEEAYDKLSYSIYHQGSIYPAAVATVPFLVELLEVSIVQGKHWILRLLRLLSTGGSWHDSHQHLKLFEESTKHRSIRPRSRRNWAG